MRRRIATLLVLFMFFGNIAAAEWVPLWQSVEEKAAEDGLERVHSVSAQWNGFPSLDAELNAFIRSMLAHSAIRRTTRKSEDIGYARWDWLLQEQSVVDFSAIVHDGIYYEQSNLFGGDTVSFDKQGFSRFLFLFAQLSQGATPGNADVLFDLMRLPLQDAASLDTLQGILKRIQEWKERSVLVLEKQRPSVALPGLFGTRAIVYQIDRAALSSLLGDLSLHYFAAEEGAGDLESPTTPGTLFALANVLSDPTGALSRLMPEDLAPIEYREIFCYDQSVSRQLEIRSGSDWLYVEWADQGDSIFVSFRFGESRASALFTFGEGAIIVGRKTQSLTNRTLLEVRLQYNDVDVTACRIGAEAFENAGTKETVSSQSKWLIQSDALWGSGETLAVSFATKDAASGEGLKYKRTRETDVILSGLGFAETPLLQIQETITFQAPSALSLDGALYPGRMSLEALEAWFEGVRSDALQVCLTILGRIPSENANFLLSKWRETR